MMDGKAQRGLSKEFMVELQEGCLRPLLDRVRADATLDMEIRQDYLNVYYRGGSLFRVERSSRATYRFKFDVKYVPREERESQKLPGHLVAHEREVKAWVGKMPQLKDAMDLWFGKHPRAEREYQQLVAWENNSSAWAAGTDYFIIDIEYANRQGARFDIVALRWDSEAAMRGLKGRDLPKLALLEVKVGDGALRGKAGLLKHIEHIGLFLENTAKVASFKEEMLQVFQQKRDLGLIKSLRANKHLVLKIAEEFEVIILLAGHDPDSTILPSLLAKIRSGPTPVLLAQTNYAGFGLYRQSVLRLTDS